MLGLSITFLSVGFLYTAFALKCFVQFSPKGKFDSEDQLDLYECPVAGHQCVYVRCIDKINKNKDEIVPNIVDCQKPEMVNCTKFTSECEGQGGRACCYICNTDGCNKSWKNSTFSSTTPTSTSTTTNKLSSTPPTEIKNKLQCLAWNICNLSTKLKQSKVSRRFAIGQNCEEMAKDWGQKEEDEQIGDEYDKSADDNGQAVNDWGERMLFLRDSKHFVDRPMKNDTKNLVEQFKTMFNVAEWKQFTVSKMNETQVDNLSKFIRQNFGMADSALAEHLPEDWVENPQNLKNIKDKNLKQWAIELNKMWKELSKKMPNDMNSKDNQRHSLIYLSDPFFVPGGRFREFRYWDSFWIARGLLASGMEKSVKNICKNFAELVNRFGYVPAGGRIYYSKRSQPPFLTYLVYDYFGATGDIEFLKEIMPTIEKELNFWQTKRTVEVKVKGKKVMFYQYRADTKLPRPEAFCHDVKLVKDIADPMEKAKIWHEIASASESGWDFSSRWIRKDEQDKERPWKLTNLMTTKIVPVDLNALICGNFEMMAHMYLQIGNKAKSREYHAKHQLFLEDFKHLFYNKEHGIWYDFNLESGTSNEAYYGSAAMPLFTRCYDVSDLGTAERMFARMDRLDTATNRKLISHPFGVPASLINDSSQQWDFPNIFPPLQHMLIEGLRRMKGKAFELAQKWVSANYKLYQDNKNCGNKMWEKISADAATPGRGGEYNVQFNFGWTIGTVLDLLVTYSDEMSLSTDPTVYCLEQKIEEEPNEFPNNFSEYRAERLTAAQKEVDEMNTSWAVVVERFALMKDEEFLKFFGTPVDETVEEDKNENNNIHLRSELKAADGEEDKNDLPTEFDAREAWKDCAEIIQSGYAQGDCGSCWAVTAARTLTDRICIARLKKGKKTNSSDPRAYVSAQFTMDCTPDTKGCSGGNPFYAWKYYRNLTVSGTNHTMNTGCKPYKMPTTSNCVFSCRKEWLQQQYPNKTKTPKTPGRIPLFGTTWEVFLAEATRMPVITGFTQLMAFNREKEMMREIMKNGPIQASHIMYTGFSRCCEHNEIYEHSANSTLRKNVAHSLKVFGWGEEKGVKFWHMANTFGADWGNAGMFRMRRGTDECRIETRRILFGTPKV
ncbi:hypothetical protein niasHS_016339 [Heterodera schachtii]|uniref:Trehalase n=1 Tax=Heterodera schachtii TaxID=97005 RepID=A0ABD2HVD1_HETSC